MIDEADLLRNIYANYQQAGPKLVYSDWLQQHGRVDEGLAWKYLGEQGKFPRRSMVASPPVPEHSVQWSWRLLLVRDASVRTGYNELGICDDDKAKFDIRPRALPCWEWWYDISQAFDFAIMRVQSLLVSAPVDKADPRKTAAPQFIIR